MFIPNYCKSVYHLEVVKATYTQYKHVGSSNRQLLTDIVRLEENKGFNQIVRAGLLLRIRNAPNWKNCSITGLRVVQKGYFYGDLSINGKKSLIVVKLSEDKSKLYLIICDAFYPLNNGQRVNLVNKFVSLMKKETE